MLTGWFYCKGGNMLLMSGLGARGFYLRKTIALVIAAVLGWAKTNPISPHRSANRVRRRNKANPRETNPIEANQKPLPSLRNAVFDPLPTRAGDETNPIPHRPYCVAIFPLGNMRPFRERAHRMFVTMRRKHSVAALTLLACASSASAGLVASKSSDGFVDSIGVNTRLRWTFTPVADLFVVYNHNVPSLAERWQLESNQLLVKLQYAWRM